MMALVDVILNVNKICSRTCVSKTLVIRSGSGRRHTAHDFMNGHLIEICF